MRKLWNPSKGTSCGASFDALLRLSDEELFVHIKGKVRIVSGKRTWKRRRRERNSSVQRADADMVTARIQVAGLQDQLQGEKLTVEQEKQLNTAAKDVRELMP